MSISKNKHYLVLNHSSSGVAISTRHDSFLVPGGTSDTPGSLPLTFDEIAEVNSKSPAFKIGLLRFEPEHETALYEALSIANWRDILTQDQIEAALHTPSLEMSQKILDIDNDLYFERIRGAMIGLRSLGVDIPGKMERMIEQRRLELARRQRKTKIQLVNTDSAENKDASQKEIEALHQELDAMKALLADLVKGRDIASNPSENVAQDQPKQKKTNSKTK